MCINLHFTNHLFKFFVLSLYFPSSDSLIVSWNLNKTLESGNLK